jgi:hypothetical protein
MERLKTRKSNGTQREAIGWSALLNRTRIAAIGEPEPIETRTHGWNPVHPTTSGRTPSVGP